MDSISFIPQILLGSIGIYPKTTGTQFVIKGFTGTQFVCTRNDDNKTAGFTSLQKKLYLHKLETVDMINDYVCYTKINVGT